MHVPDFILLLLPWLIFVSVAALTSVEPPGNQDDRWGEGWGESEHGQNTPVHETSSFMLGKGWGVGGGYNSGFQPAEGNHCFGYNSNFIYVGSFKEATMKS